MATTYGPTTAAAAWHPEMRSVTPATNNTRFTGTNRYASAPRMGGAPPHTSHPSEGGDQHPFVPARSLTPSRYVGPLKDAGGLATSGMNLAPEPPRTPSSTGLIRLSLKKPMGIVFEPMYDPNQPSLQRGVRICDLPRTGAAALSRKLQVGDELLQINETTVSRLTFDEIMDFIIEADPESVNLLFRRPRKETLQQRQGVQQKIKAANNKDAPSTVKWVDEEESGDKIPTNSNNNKDRKKKKDGKQDSKRSKKDAMSEEEETLQSSTVGEESYTKKSRRKKSKTRKDPYESESFLDMLIDTLCSNPNNVCRDSFRRRDDEYSDDEESFVSDRDEETYATYEESLDQPKKGKSSNSHKKKKADYDDPEEEEEEEAEDSDDRANIKSQSKKEKVVDKVETKSDRKYEDDGTLETLDTTDRPKEEVVVMAPPIHAPLGLAPKPEPVPQPVVLLQSDNDDDGNPAPIKELEYDDRIDHGADVSVMESLGGPSLLIEKQRAASQQQPITQVPKQAVPGEIMQTFGLDYPAAHGLTRVQTIEADPLKFYTFVVKMLLQENEPEKVRLLDKLLAKYKGREDHLVQKLAVRYSRPSDDQANKNGAGNAGEQEEAAFTDAVKKSKASATTATAVTKAKERILHGEPHNNEPGAPARNHMELWPEKEEKEAEDEEDEEEGVEEEEDSESGSEYSRDSVDGTSPAVIAQVSELLNYVYGKTSVPGQIDRVSTIMRAYEGREAVLLELLETKALIKANKEKENVENLPSFLRSSHISSSAQRNADELEGGELPPVTPLATHPQGTTAIHDDISSMSGVSSPAHERDQAPPTPQPEDEVTTTNGEREEREGITPMSGSQKVDSTLSGRQSSTRVPPTTPDRDRKKKKGLFGGLFGKKKGKEAASVTSTKPRNGRTSRA